MCVTFTQEFLLNLLITVHPGTALNAFALVLFKYCSENQIFVENFFSSFFILTTFYVEHVGLRGKI